MLYAVAGTDREMTRNTTRPGRRISSCQVNGKRPDKLGSEGLGKEEMLDQEDPLRGNEDVVGRMAFRYARWRRLWRRLAERCIAVGLRSTCAAQKSEEGLYITIAITATIIQVKAFNYSRLQSVSQLLTSGTEAMNPFS